MNIYYRLSNNSYKKNRLPHATKEHCLDNFLSIFGQYNITLIADNVTEPSLLEFIKSKQSDKFKIEYTSLGNGQCFKHCLHKACNELKEDEIIYFCEDDYLHLPESDILLMEGLELSNYCSTFDHLDKYINADSGGNPQVESGGELTRVVLTKSSHWKITNSFTCTFATTIKTLKEDIDIWDKYLTGSYPRDYEAFTDLIQNKGRSLISSIPGRSTHTELPWISPFTPWNTI